MLSETLQEIAFAAAESLALDDVLARIVQGLVETAGVALARIWLVGPGDVCAACAMRPECRDQTRCLHLAASAGRPLIEPPETWGRIDGGFRRMPFGARKVGQIAARGEAIWIRDVREESTWIARPEWARSESIHSFAGHPLMFRGELLGVLAIFRRGRSMPRPSLGCAPSPPRPPWRSRTRMPSPSSAPARHHWST